MNTKIINVLMFTAGATIGSVVTWRLLDTKYKKIAQEEIDSVKEVFANREPLSYEHESEVIGNVESVEHSDNGLKVKVTPKPSLTDYAKMLSEEGYTNYSEMSKSEPVEKKEEEDIPVEDRPYVISPDEFDEHPDYEKRSLTYYADKVLADEDDEPIEDIDTLVGLDSLKTFGTYEDDSVFVRDDVLKCDYEILLDLRRYQDVMQDYE